MATKGTVSGVIANMVTLVVDGPVAQNEICYISTGGDKLMAEVIKVVGTQVYVQVFESTRGLKVGAEAEFTGHMLEVTLGPGMLSKNYDGLQNDLDKMDGVFLKRGQYTYPLDKGSRWHFVPLAKVGDQVEAAAWLGQVDENFQPLKIMVPFEQKGVCTVKSIAKEGDYSIEDTIAVLTDGEGNDIRVNMIQKWPVKRAMTNYKEKPRPFKLLETKEKPQKLSAMREFLTIEELRQLMATPCRYDIVKKAFLFSCFTGLRYSDMMTLKWSEIHTAADGKTLYIEHQQVKTKNTVTIPLSNEALKWMPRKSKDDDRVFHQLRITSTTVEVVLGEWMQEAGIQKHITYHCFRHSYATLQLAGGTDIYTVSKMLGHTNVRTTQVYAKVVDAKKEEATKTIKLDLPYY